MATPTPSSLFLRLANVWRHLYLRSDIDDVILELLGRFSLEKVYAASGDKDTYQHLVISLLAQLNAIFYLQRLTLPTENAHVGWYLGFLVSWEVALRSVEFVLQIVAEGRESLWSRQPLRDRYLAEFLLSALRVLTLHPKSPANQRARDRRDRFSRVHGSLEQVLDSYPGPKSFLLEVCKEVASQLHNDPEALALPPRLRSELPNLASELYPLSGCLLPPHISELVPCDDFGSGWLAQFLALRDVSHFVVAASVQYAANRETREVRLQSSSARSRNAVLNALDNLRIPPRLSKVDMVAVFSATFRVILPDTLELSRRDISGPRVDEYELDALDSFCARLKERQIIHRVSDREMMHGVSQVIKNILLQNDPSGHFSTASPGLYAVNCSECHLIGAAQLRSSFNLNFPPDHMTELELRLPPNSRCIYCRGAVSLAREVPLARQAAELLTPLQPDIDTVNVERHLPTHFQLGPPKSEAHGTYNPGGYVGGGYVGGGGGQRSRDLEPYSPFSGRLALPSPISPDCVVPAYSSLSLPLPRPSGNLQVPGTLRTLQRSDDSAYHAQAPPENVHEATYTLQDSAANELPPFSPEYIGFRRPSQPGPEHSPILTTAEVAQAPRVTPLITPPDKGKSKWRLKLPGTRKVSIGASGDSSSLSSTALEAQRLEEIPLGGLINMPKATPRGKAAKSISVHLSQNSTLALFWTQSLIHVWDVGTSPPTMVRPIVTESTCILAAVARMHLAYVIGTRDQKLTLRIVNILQPTTAVVEYRIPSSLWCRSMAIDREENYVVVGFENSTIRFFKTTSTEQPREDRLHGFYHKECKTCPPVDTLAFSSDGLVLLASTRSPKTGLIQIYTYTFPYHTFKELAPCRYQVPLHESEDNGISSAIFRPGAEGEENTVCITTWTQSGTPILIQPHDGHRSEVKTEASSRHKLGNRIQCAEFSPSGRELAMVNDKGYLYQISNLNSSTMDIRRTATSKELTTKSDSFSMAFMTLSDEEYIVLAWADFSKAVGWIKKIPAVSRGHIGMGDTPGMIYEASAYPEPRITADVQGECPQPPKPPAELAATEREVSVQEITSV